MYDLEEISDTKYDTCMESISNNICSLYDYSRSRFTMHSRSNRKNSINIIANIDDHKISTKSDEMHNVKYKSYKYSTYIF